MFPTELLADTAVVYTPDQTGAFTTVANAALACWLRPVGTRAAASAAQRAELAALRRLTWVDYVMPDYAQVEIDGNRYNVVHGTVVGYRYAETGEVIQYSCDLIEVE